jgi:hypothetical protein
MINQWMSPITLLRRCRAAYENLVLHLSAFPRALQDEGHHHTRMQRAAARPPGIKIKSGSLSLDQRVSLPIFNEPQMRGRRTP